MKKVGFLLTAFILGLSAYVPLFAQSTGGQVIFFAPDSVRWTVVCPSCSTNVYTATTSSGYAPGETAQIDIDWGDGTTESHTVTFVQQNFYTPSAFAHLYGTAGSYPAVFSFADNQGNVDSATVNYLVTPNCGNLYANVMLDSDNDGTADVSIPDALIDMAGNNGMTFTYPLPGQYAHIGGINNLFAPYVVSVNPVWLASNGYVMSPASPGPQTVPFNNCSYSTDLPTFIVTCDPGNPVSQTDLAVRYMYGWGFRAGQSTGFLKVDVCNYSCSGSQNANFQITFESLLTVASHDIPGATVSGNTISANLNVNGCTTYTVYFSVPGATPAFTQLNFSAGVTPVGNTDFDPSNNNTACVGEVRNSWDPNDKTANLPEIISPAVQDEFTYLVRFQNMGNDEAYHIVVRDTLDDDLDLLSFQLLELSHNGSVSVDPATRIATFDFPNIFLAAASVNEPASHGYLVYKIREKASLPVGTEIKNTAYIYFDANPPVITNTTFNVNQVSGVQENAAVDFSVFPVPASDFITVASGNNEPLGSVKLVDMTGKTVFGTGTGQSVYRLDVQGISAGVYSLVIGTQGVNKKVVIQK